jgi:hypothetical protein
MRFLHVMDWFLHKLGQFLPPVSCSTGNPLMKFLTDASVSLDIRHPLGSKCQWKNALQTDFVQM